MRKSFPQFVRFSFLFFLIFQTNICLAIPCCQNAVQIRLDRSSSWPLEIHAFSGVPSAEQHWRRVACRAEAWSRFNPSNHSIQGKSRQRAARMDWGKCQDGVPPNSDFLPNNWVSRLILFPNEFIQNIKVNWWNGFTRGCRPTTIHLEESQNFLGLELILTDFSLFAYSPWMYLVWFVLDKKKYFLHIRKLSIWMELIYLLFLINLF